MIIRVLESARKDIVDGYHFYEKQAEGIGTYFLDSISADIESLAENAGIHPIYFDTFHRLLAARFPFAVYYQVSGDTVLVYAVLDCRSEPAWIRTRLK